MSEPVFSVSQAVAVINQTFEAVYPTLTIVGELAEYKIAKGRWVYADLKDEAAKIRLFGTIYQLPAPLEDGMMVEVEGEPRLHPQFGFSLNIRTIRPVGEGSLRRAANLLQSKLESEGLFSPERKRSVPYGPVRVGLITSETSAAFADFTKIMSERWQGVELQVYDVLVQGESAPQSIIEALAYFNQSVELPDVVVLIRGGGSADDLSAFSSEQVVRAVAASRAPTLVAIGHESDTSLAELAADKRASTPSNAAELLFPDKREYRQHLRLKNDSLQNLIASEIESRSVSLNHTFNKLFDLINNRLDSKQEKLTMMSRLLESTHPRTSLRRGYALVNIQGKLVRSAKELKPGTSFELKLQDGDVSAHADEVK